MANYKKKNGKRKRDSFNGFRWITNFSRAAIGDMSRYSSAIRRFIRQSSKANEE